MTSNLMDAFKGSLLQTDKLKGHGISHMLNGNRKDKQALEKRICSLINNGQSHESGLVRDRLRAKLDARNK